VVFVGVHLPTVARGHRDFKVLPNDGPSSVYSFHSVTAASILTTSDSFHKLKTLYLTTQNNINAIIVALVNSDVVSAVPSTCAQCSASKM